MPIHLRQATNTDASIVGEMVACLLRELAPDHRFDTDVLIGTASEMLALPTVTGILASNGDTPIGLMMLNECAAIYSGGRFGEITELYVIRTYRSHGVASLLLAEAEALGVQQGWKRIEVGAPQQPHWSRTLGFYLREGFVEVGPRLRRLL